jgi:excisionase family DNA binding protein
MSNLLKIKEALGQLKLESPNEQTCSILTLIVGEIGELQSQMLKPVINFKEACSYTGYSPQHLRKMIRDCKIPYYKPEISGSGKLFFKREELDNYLTGNRFAPLCEADQAAATYLATK